MKHIYRQAKICFWLLLSSVALSESPVGWAETDLMDKGKSDTAIKMLVFPKSLRVIENRVNAQAILPDPKKKILLKLDPLRVAPAKAGELISGPVTRDRLRKLAMHYGEDVIFIFRRTLKTGTEKQGIRYQGLLYLSRQKKVLALKESEKSALFPNMDSSEQKAQRWQSLDESGLKALAEEAKKVLQSHKFEIRRSY